MPTRDRVRPGRAERHRDGLRKTGRPARLDSYADASGDAADDARDRGISSSVGAPISVEGRLWGIMVAASIHGQRLPPNTEARLADFTELVATAIANAEAREELRRVADEQAALRRVATLVAQGAPSAAVFDAVTEEVGRLLPADVTVLCRYDPDGYMTRVGEWSRTPGPIPRGEPGATRRPERRHPCVRDRPAGAHRRLRRRRGPGHCAPGAPRGCARRWARRSASRDGCGAWWS